MATQDDCGTDGPDIEFNYEDTDVYRHEIAELYSYSEVPEFQLNVKEFEDQMEKYGVNLLWQEQSLEQKKTVIAMLLNQLEVSNNGLRMKAARCFLYLAQGCWAEMKSDKEQQACTKDNVMLLYELQVFHAFIDLLDIEIGNSTTATTAMTKDMINLVDNMDLRVILSVLYIITETIRCVQADDPEEWVRLHNNFKNDISDPIKGELIAVKLFRMMTRFCDGSAPHFPMKKVVLLLWKIMLISLGGNDHLRNLKRKYREQAGLSVFEEDTTEVVRTKRAFSPPASAADLLEPQSLSQEPNSRPYSRSLMKQSSLDESLRMGFEQSEEEKRELEDQQAVEDTGNMPQPPSPNMSVHPPTKGLPKARQKDLDTFLEKARIKFGVPHLQGDRESLFGLPQPTQEALQVLKKHIYTSLAEIQVQQEEDISKSPMSVKEPPIELTPTETLYQGLLPNLPQYMSALLKILLAAAPTAKVTIDSVYIMTDMLPELKPMKKLELLKFNKDMARHKEIVMKAVSAILLLLLKHLKINHTLQFEFVSQTLVFANCISIIHKIFHMQIMAYVGAKNMIPILDFPTCVIGDEENLTLAESMKIGDSQQYCWRNMFSCINLLRVLNKLTKWKHSRIMMLLLFKSNEILKRVLMVRHPMMQLYVLKLLKMQSIYLGKRWRKSNMKIVNAIYYKVRHRFNDDWAYGNVDSLNEEEKSFVRHMIHYFVKICPVRVRGFKINPEVQPEELKVSDEDLVARPWDIQPQECALRASTVRFNTRRYSPPTLDPDFEPVDSSTTSVLGPLNNTELPEGFAEHYEEWLQQEVYQAVDNWDEILNHSYL